MIKKQMDTAENSEQLIDSLRRGYSGGREKTLYECPFSEQAIAYAYEELAPDAQQTMDNHLEYCPACMDLILDARTAEIESQEAAKQLPGVLPALSEAINRPSQSSLLERLAAGTFITLKIIAAPVAVVCFMLIIARLDVLDNVNFTIKQAQTSEWSQPTKSELSPIPAAGKKRAGRSGADSQKDLAAVDSFSMHDGWSVDPFEPLYRNHSRRAASKKKARARTPLEAIDPSQLKLVGVMLSDKGNQALVEDASGKGYVVREGIYIGTNAGRVTRILKDRLIIEENIEDVHGKLMTQKSVLKLNKP